MRSMLMLLPEGRGKGNKKEQWKQKSGGATVPNCFPDHNATMLGNSVRCSTIRNSHGNELVGPGIVGVKILH